MLLLPLPGEQSYSVQLHTHGPLSESSGSLEWHHSYARDLGVDAIWWTDHDWRVTRWNHTVRFDFENTTYDALTGDFSEPDDAAPGDFRLFERYTIPPSFHRKEVVDTLAYEGTHSLLLSIEDQGGTPLYKTIDYRQMGSRKQNMYALVHRPKIRFALFPEVLDPATDRFVLHLTLSERQGSWHQLRYVIGSHAGRARPRRPAELDAGPVEHLRDRSAGRRAGAVDGGRRRHAARGGQQPLRDPRAAADAQRRFAAGSSWTTSSTCSMHRRTATP